MQIGEPKRIYRVEPLQAPVSAEPQQLPRTGTTPRRAKIQPELKPAALR